MRRRIVPVLAFNLVFLLIGFYFGILFHEANTESEVIETVVYRYPNSLPYQTLPDPISYEQAIKLLEGMRLSHVQALNWTFESDPGFGIADKALQRTMIHWYDQLIEFVQRKNEDNI